MKSLLLCESTENFNWVFLKESVDYIKNNLGGDGIVYNKEWVLRNKSLFSDTEFIFSTWVMPSFTEDEIKEYFPKLECIFYAAGTVKDFALPFLNCGVKIFSAWKVNAIPVAEYTTAQIILANVGYFPISKDYSSGNTKTAKDLSSHYNGNYNNTVGIIGAGTIGRLVIDMLKRYQLNVIAYDPFLPDEIAYNIGLKKVTLEELFSKSNVISNHLADNEATRNILDKKLFESMLPYSTFINTGRGKQVVEADLIEVLKKRKDITALLDVTVCEPPDDDSELYSLDNCFMTPHIAGSNGHEVWRLSKFAIDECERYIRGETCDSEISKEMFNKMA